MRRLLRTIRLDASDSVVFAHPAQPGEWAVAGSFLFTGRDVEAMSRKERIAFRTGFLGVASWGFSTLTVVSEATEVERTAAVEALAGQFVARLGAPDLAAARPASEEELAFSEGLCQGHDVGTLVALAREAEEGAIRERFRTLKPRAEAGFGAPYLRGHDKAFAIVETDEDGPEEQVDLVALLRSKR